jgi:hypothetical protein
MELYEKMEKEKRMLDKMIQENKSKPEILKKSKEIDELHNAIIEKYGL